MATYFETGYFPDGYFPTGYFGSYVESQPCGIDKRLPTSWISETLRDLNDRIANPTGIWADFNCLHQAWRVITYAILEKKIYCPDDLPPEPLPEDYPDTDSPTTITNCGISMFKNFPPGVYDLDDFYAGTFDTTYNDGRGFNSPYDWLQ